MRWAIPLLFCACHASEPKTAAIVVDLPKAEPQTVVRHEPGPPHFSMIVDFAVLRAHPAGAQLAVLIPALPVWREYLPGTKIDVMKDCDWISIEGANVHDASEDVVLVHYLSKDSDVESAVRAQNQPFDTDEPTVAGWSSGRSAFLRPKNDHVLAIVPQADAKAWVKKLAAAPIGIGRAADRAVDIRSSSPHELIPMFPSAFLEERITITSQGPGARLHIEGDCSDKDSAAKAATELEHEVHVRNTLAVKVVTHGAFSSFKAETKGSMVVADVPFSAEQVDAVLEMTALAEGAKLPKR
jgi:hypothetical protein